MPREQEPEPDAEVLGLAGRSPVRSAEEAEALLLEVVARHSGEVLRTARRHTMCAEDAEDAYQRALEIFMRHGRRLDRETAVRWLFTVARHEAQAITRRRRVELGPEEFDADRLEARHAPSPEDRVLCFEDVEQSAEALRHLKPGELRALWLKAGGRSYAEIQELTGWSYTNVSRRVRPRCVRRARRP
jgi:RNA polymerase sigma factor (sigma-70 family)